MEKLIQSIDGVSACEYTLSPTADIYEIEYQHMKFALFVDVDDGCDLKSLDRDNLLDVGKKFVDILEKLVIKNQQT
jgi:hypothetical protein